MEFETGMPVGVLTIVPADVLSSRIRSGETNGSISGIFSAGSPTRAKIVRMKSAPLAVTLTTSADRCQGEVNHL